MPSPPFRGEREGTRRASEGESEGGRRRGFPHLNPALSAPKGGQGDFQLPADGLQNAPKVLHYVSVPDPDHPITAVCNLQAAPLVCLRSKRVLPAIELYDQLCCWTSKVHNVSANRVLPTKTGV